MGVSVDTGEEKYCYQCKGWQYNELIERKYGEGTGLCNGEPKGCCRRACVLFEKRE